MKVSYELTKELYNQRSTWIKFKEAYLNYYHQFFKRIQYMF